MSRNNNSCSKKNDDGFSIIEVVVSLALFSLLGIALGSAAVQSIRALEYVNKDLLFTSSIAIAENYLRKNVAEVRFPFWLSQIPSLEEGDSLSLPYYQGDGNKFLDIKFENSVLTISIVSKNDSEPTVRTFPQFARVTWELASDEESGTFGIIFSLVPAGSPETTIQVATRFGSLPIQKLYK
jgi:prepilin-type N-terminal cleavage/methylation domain-containing protein